jgi:hypothetical protein
MKNYIWVMPGGGIFSRFLQCGIIPMADYEFDNAYLVLSGFALTDPDDPYAQASWAQADRNCKLMAEYGIEDPYEHIVNYAIDQKVDRTYQYQGYLPVGTMYDRNNPIELSPKLDSYKRTLQKIHIKSDIVNRVNTFVRDLSISSRTLGVHVRLTTMKLHQNYEQVSLDDYIRTIDKELETGNYDNMYTATDNVESLIKLERRYGNIIRYYPNLLRLPSEDIRNIDEFSWEYDMFFRKKFWQESYLECMTLSNCGGLVCRDSNFSNMAVVFSNSIKKVARVNNA